MSIRGERNLQVCGTVREVTEYTGCESRRRPVGKEREQVRGEQRTGKRTQEMGQEKQHVYKNAT